MRFYLWSRRLITSRSANAHLHELVEELPMRKVLAIVAYVDRAVIIAMSSISRQDVMKKASTIRQAVGF